jgi:hypothetical protein
MRATTYRCESCHWSTTRTLRPFHRAVRSSSNSSVTSSRATRRYQRPEGAWWKPVSASGVAGEQRLRAVVVDAHELRARGDAGVAEPPQREDVAGDVAVLELGGGLEPQDVDGAVVRAERGAVVAEAVHLEELRRRGGEGDVLRADHVSRDTVMACREDRPGQSRGDRLLHEGHDGHPCAEIGWNRRNQTDRCTIVQRFQGICPDCLTCSSERAGQRP